MPIARAIGPLSTAARTIAPQQPELAFQIVGQGDQQLHGAEQEPGRRNRDEDEADREEYLRQLTRGIQARVQQPFEYHAPGRDQHERKRESQRVRHAEPVHRGDEDVAARHGEHAVGQVDETHHAHRHRQADRNHVEDHAVSGAMKDYAHYGRQECFHTLLAVRGQAPGK